MTTVYDLTLDELTERLTAWGEPPFRATQVHRPRKRDEVRGVAGIERHIDGIESGLREAGVVHGRRQ